MQFRLGFEVGVSCPAFVDADSSHQHPGVNGNDASISSVRNTELYLVGHTSNQKEEDEDREELAALLASHGGDSEC